MHRDYLRVFSAKFLPRRCYSFISSIWNRFIVRAKENRCVYRDLFFRDQQEVTVKLRSLRHPFRFRRCASHAEGILQNVLRQEYDAFPPLTPPQTIIDAGAFIGDLSAHWATRFPTARIIGLEPNAENYRLAEINLRAYGPSVVCLQQGLWSHPCKLRVSGDEMASTVCEVTTGSYDVEATDVPSLMATYHSDHIDILKLDIEGAEGKVLGPGAEKWLGQISLLIVEFHDVKVELMTMKFLQACGFSLHRHRSLHFFRNESTG